MKDYIKAIEGAERRFFTSDVEIREDGGGNVVQGVAAVVEKATDLGWFREKIAVGAFDDVMKDDVRCLFNHDSNFVLARSNNGEGTLRLFLTDEGHLGYEYETPDRSYAKDLLDAIRSGDVSQSSFAFSIKEQKWTYAEEGMEQDERTILKLARLYDVAPVTYPAYQDTSVAARSLQIMKDQEQELRTTYQKDMFELDQLLMKNGI